MAIPVAIILAGLLVGGGIYFSGRNTNVQPETVANNTEQKNIADINLRPISAKDHVIGAKDATVTFVEYSDLECPFCKTFHATIQRLMDTYNDRVAWVYRHFPIAQLHSKAAKEAQATECAADQGKFWEYLNKVFEITPSNNGLDAAELPKIASGLGLDVTTFNNCLGSTAHVADISQSVKDAETAGANGTPTSFIVLTSPLSEASVGNINIMTASFKFSDGTPLVTISKDRKIISIIGALPYDIIKGLIDVSLGVR